MNGAAHRGCVVFAGADESAQKELHQVSERPCTRHSDDLLECQRIRMLGIAETVGEGVGELQTSTWKTINKHRAAACIGHCDDRIAAAANFNLQPTSMATNLQKVCKKRVLPYFSKASLALCISSLARCCSLAASSCRSVIVAIRQHRHRSGNKVA